MISLNLPLKLELWRENRAGGMAELRLHGDAPGSQGPDVHQCNKWSLPRSRVFYRKRRGRKPDSFIKVNYDGERIYDCTLEEFIS